MAENEYLENAVGQSFEIHLTTLKEKDGGFWSTIGGVKFGVTNDRENWAYKEANVKIHERSVDESIASVMLHFSNIINDPKVIEELEVKLNEFEDGSQ